jgi:hypothetical protein
MPERKSATVYDLYNRLGVKGDKKQVYRPELIRPFYSPTFSGEKLFPTCYKYFQVDLTHEMLLFNEPVCVVEYMPDGSSRNMYSQYIRNPKGFCNERRFVMQYAPSIKIRFVSAVHYVAESIIAKDRHFVKHSTNKPATVLAIPFGVALYFWIRMKTK